LITAHQSLSIRYYPLDIDNLSTTQSVFGSSSSNQEIKLNQTTTTLKNGKLKLPFLSYNRQLTKKQTHQSPIISLSVSPPLPGSSHAIDEHGNEVENTLFASGSADGVVKVWDTKGGFVTHVFKGHGGGVSAIGWRFLQPLLGESIDTRGGDHHNDDNSGGYKNANVQASSSSSSSTEGKVMQLITGSVDSRVRIFDLLDVSHRSANGGKPEFILEGHVSVVRGIDVNRTFDDGDLAEQEEEGRWMVTAGRDRVVLLWDFGSRLGSTNRPSSSSRSQGVQGKKWEKEPIVLPPKTIQTTLTNETIESVGLVDPSVFSSSGVKLGKGKRGLVAFTGGEKGVVKLWDVQRGKELGRMDGPGGRKGEDHDDDEGVVDGDDEDDEDAEERGIRDVL
jgi:U3 small nucleolar RNA-associated protein 13